MAWLSGWSHRKTISITGQTGAGTNYQVDFSIGDGSGGDFHLESHCTSFPNDIQVTDNDQTTTLDYFVEDLTLDPITMWVEVADDLGGNVDICVYYGKAGESSASDGDETFLLFDHFEGTSIDTSKWTGDTGDTSVSSSIVSLTKTNGDSFVFSQSTYNYKRLRGKVQHLTYDGTTAHDSGFGFRTNNAWTDAARIFTYSGQYWKTSVHSGGTATTVDSSVSADTSWHIHEILWKSGETKNYNDGALLSTIIDLNVPSTSIPVFLRAYATAGNTTTTKLDWVFVSKYVSPDPAFSSAGSEEDTRARSYGYIF